MYASLSKQIGAVFRPSLCIPFLHSPSVCIQSTRIWYSHKLQHVFQILDCISNIVCKIKLRYTYKYCLVHIRIPYRCMRSVFTCVCVMHIWYVVFDIFSKLVHVWCCCCQVVMTKFVFMRRIQNSLKKSREQTNERASERAKKRNSKQCSVDTKWKTHTIMFTHRQLSHRKFCFQI